MAEVKFDGIEKVYDNGVRAVRDLSLEIPDGEFLVLVGPSGCGKTTALRMVAGLEEISGGTLSIGGRVVNDLTPKQRDIAMVFQSYALYPHLSVAENIAFGLRLRKTAKSVIAERVAWAAKLLDLTPYLDRRPKQLSGGQRQRVAMGRAIVRQPQVFLMDEPLSNLDAKLRVQMRADISKLQRDLGTTTVYVTHDQVEAMTMGDRVAVMNQGLLQQVDVPQRLYDKPANLIEADVTVEADVVTLLVGGQRLPVPAAALQRYPGLRGAGGRRIVVGLRAGDLHLARDRPGLPALTARLELIEVLGSESIAYFRIDAMAIRPEGVDEETDDEMEGQGVTAARPNFVASVPAESAYGLEIDTEVTIAVDAAKLHAFDQETGEPLR
jgi:multiple sugar transport system ATP-binding protein